MSTEDFKVGRSVVVVPNTLDPDSGLDIGGWQGRITAVDMEEKLICIAWDSLTLNAMPGEMIDQCEEEGLDWREYSLAPQDVALARPRDREADVEDVIEALESKHGWSYLGEEGRRIQAVLANAKDDRETSAFSAWQTHLQQTLTFPFDAEVSEWQERGPLRTGESVTVLGIEGSEDPYGVLVSLQRGRQRFVFPLCDLEAEDGDSPNYDPVKDYAVWFANR